MSTSNTQVRILESLDHAEFIDARFTKHRFPIHFHDTFVIQLVTSGADWCCGSDLVANQGELFVHFPFAAHTGGTLSDRELEYQAIYPSVKLFCELTGVDECSVPVGGAVVSRDSRLVRIVSDAFVKCRESNSQAVIGKELRQVFFAIMDQLPERFENSNGDAHEPVLLSLIHISEPTRPY